MSLASAKVLFVFLEVASVARARALLEGALGLRVIERRFHPPHHRHGVVKYDAGSAILALNAAAPGFDPGARDGLVQVYELAHTPALAARLEAVGGASFDHASKRLIDADGHEYLLAEPARGRDGAGPRLVELQLTVSSLPRARAFYQDVLGLERTDIGNARMDFAAGNLRLSVRGSAPGPIAGRQRQDGCLIVFHCHDIDRAHAELSSREVRFRSEIQRSEIGRSVQFVDEWGHRFCLYEPSEESLCWESGAKVRAIMEGGV